MPRFKEYSSQVSLPGGVQTRNATAEDFGGVSAEGLQQVGEGISRFADVIERRKEQSELSKLNVGFAQLRAQKTIEWKEKLKNADPNDSSWIDGFIEGYSQDADKLAELASTSKAKNYFETTKGNLTASFYEDAVAAQMELAGVAAVSNHNEGVRNNAIAVRQNPTSIAATVQATSDYLASLDTIPQGVKIKLLDQAKQTYAEEAVRGWIDHMPKGATNEDYEKLKERIKDPNGELAGYLKGDTIKQLMSETDAIQRARLQDELNEKKLEKERKKEADLKISDDFIKSWSNGTLKEEDVVRSSLDPSDKQHFINLARDIDKRKSSDNSKMGALAQMITRGQIDENGLRAYVGDGLTVNGYNSLLDFAQKRHTSEGRYEQKAIDGFLSAVKHKLSKSNDLLQIKDPEGDQLYEDFQVRFYSEYSKLRQKGFSTEDLLTSEGKAFMGKNLPQRSGTQVINRTGLQPIPNPLVNVEALTPSDKQWKPGESAQEVLRKNGK